MVVDDFCSIYIDDKVILLYSVKKIYMQTLKHQSPFSLQTKTKQNLGISSSTYHDTMQFVFKLK